MERDGLHPPDQAEMSASFLRAARAANLDKVIDYLRAGIDINTCNQNGLNALHLAAKEGHSNVVSELLRKGALVDAATKKGNTALHIASLAGQEEVVKILLENGAKVNAQSQNGFTPLYMSAQENHLGIVTMLLNHGANQNLTTEDGFTPLAVALQQGHDKVVALLLEHSIQGRIKLPALHIAAKKDDVKAADLLLKGDHDVDATSKSLFTPLHIAAHYGNVRVATLFIKHGANINFKAKNGISPLHVAAKWGKAEVVILLVENHADVDCKTKDGLSPLHCAARSGHMAVVEVLLKHGADVHAKTKNGLTALHMAAQGDHTGCARLLLQAGAKVDDVTVDYLTPLHVSSHCGNFNMAKLLLDSKCEIDLPALNGFTALHIACKKNRIRIIELLLRHKAGLDATTESGLTPLHVSAFMGHVEIVVFLIRHGAKPDMQTVRGETPLHLATRAQHYDVVQQLLLNNAKVDVPARESQTALHIAARLGNADIASLLLQHGANANAAARDGYTALHVATREGHDEIVLLLLDRGADANLLTKKGFSPLQLATKFGHHRSCYILLERGAQPDLEGRNCLTALHLAAHYNRPNIAILLLENGASPHAAAKNGYSALHIAAKKNLLDIGATLLENGANPNAESKSGFSPLHVATLEGHAEMVALLLDQKASAAKYARNGLTPLHLAAQEDRVNCAELLVRYGSPIDPQTKAGYTPLHTACHFGQINMVLFLLGHGADVNATTRMGYTPLHQAAQQGHIEIVNILLKYNADPNIISRNNQTALSIAIRLNYISLIEVLRQVTTVEVTERDVSRDAVTTPANSHYEPERMDERLVVESDEEQEGGDILGREDIMPQSPVFTRPQNQVDMQFPQLEEGKLQRAGSVNSEHLAEEVSEQLTWHFTPVAAKNEEEKHIMETERHRGTVDTGHIISQLNPDNVAVDRAPLYSGFLVSFLVDARGGAMRGCRHSGTRIIVPPRKLASPTRITCKLLRKEKLASPPLLNEGEGLACRIIQMGPVGCRFLGPVIIEMPHFAALRDRERELIILRSDDGQTWREHAQPTDTHALNETVRNSFDGGDNMLIHGVHVRTVSVMEFLSKLESAEDLFQNRIIRIVTEDFPKYFAIVSRLRQDIAAVGPNGGVMQSSVCPQAQATFPEGALTKTIKIGVQAHVIPPALVARLFGNRIAVSPVVTIEPRRRKFHRPITLTIPLPKSNRQTNSQSPTGTSGNDKASTSNIHLLCSITGGQTPAQWEDITKSTPLTFGKDNVSFNTTVSARFWLVDCQNDGEPVKMATEIYREAIAVPYMAKFAVFAKRLDANQARLRVFCMTDDKMDKTLENQQQFTEIARSREVEVLEGRPLWVEMAGNLKPLYKADEQPSLVFKAFQENRLPFATVIKDQSQEAAGRIAFMPEARRNYADVPHTPLCNLNLSLPALSVESSQSEPVDLIGDGVSKQDRHQWLEKSATTEHIAKADVRLPDIAVYLNTDWPRLAPHLDLDNVDISTIATDKASAEPAEQALAMLHLWLKKKQQQATGNVLHRALRAIGREDIIRRCLTNMAEVTDELEKAVAKLELEKSDYSLPRQDTSMSSTTATGTISRGYSLDVNYGDDETIRDTEKSLSADGLKDATIKEEDAEGVVRTPPPSPQEAAEVNSTSNIADNVAQGGETDDINVEKPTIPAITSEEYVDENGVTTKVQRTNSSTTTYTSVVPPPQDFGDTGEQAGEHQVPVPDNSSVEVGEAKVILRRELRKTAVRRGSKDEVTTVTESRTYELEGDLDTTPPEVRAQMESEVEKFLSQQTPSVPSNEAAEPEAAEHGAVEHEAAEHEAVEHEAAEPNAAADS